MTRFDDALFVQDGVNLGAIARLLVEAADQVLAETGSTRKVWQDPAVRLIVNKLESLTNSSETFSETYHQCKLRVTK